MTAKINLDSSCIEEAAAAYEYGAGIPQVAAMLNVSTTTAYRTLKKAEVHMRTYAETSRLKNRASFVGIAERYRNGESIGAIAKSARISYTAIRNELLRLGLELRRPGAKAGMNNHQFKGGTKVYGDGYVKIRGSRNGSHQHRLIAEMTLGRPLRSNEIVHHINCDRADNRPENLIICTQAYHAGLHARMRKHPYWSQFNNQEKTK